MLKNCYKIGEENWSDTAEDEAAEAPDPWFRPVWEDLEDETNCTPRPGFPSQPWTSRSAGGAEAALLGPLAMAQDALARLDAMAELLSPALRDGLVARLAYAEAAGLLASRGGFAHPLDLALRDAERIGRRDLMARGRPADEAPPAEGGNGLNPAEAGTGWTSMKRSAVRCNWRGCCSACLPWPLHRASLGGTLRPRRTIRWRPPRRLGPGCGRSTRRGRAVRCGPFRPLARGALAGWAAARDEQPALLRAAAAAAAWMESGIADRPDAAQALAVAGMLLRRTGTLKTIPLTIWAGWAALCAAGDPGLLPRLRGDVAARLAGSPGRRCSCTLWRRLRAPDRERWVPCSGPRRPRGARRRGGSPLAAARSAGPAAAPSGADRPGARGLAGDHAAGGIADSRRIAAAGVAAEVTGREAFGRSGSCAVKRDPARFAASPRTSPAHRPRRVAVNCSDAQ